ncbi:protein LTO1 homolog isoform X3 [Lethenteron reissneri]|uniref:protein LTO1 homolog isoform X3 n=1 Tax=Lethenteron reissneri TaxID=7753 RepID=UPI002AB7AF74|nr:protein LTO1 homolog isoform X3 [Lethenteron reissneri]
MENHGDVAGDIFDSIVMAPERRQVQGHEEGFERGRRQGLVEGWQLGVKHGGAIAAEHSTMASRLPGRACCKEEVKAMSSQAENSRLWRRYPCSSAAVRSRMRPILSCRKTWTRFGLNSSRCAH